MTVGYSRVPHILSQSNLLDPYSFRILIFLASYNPCYPGYDLISKKCKISRAQVAKSLKILRLGGFIKYQKGNFKKGSNIYVVTLTPCQSTVETSAAPLTPCQSTVETKVVHSVDYDQSTEWTLKRIKKKNNKKGSAGPLDEGPPLVKVRSGCADTKKISECVDEMIKSLH